MSAGTALRVTASLVQELKSQDSKALQRHATKGGALIGRPQQPPGDLCAQKNGPQVHGVCVPCDTGVRVRLHLDHVHGGPVTMPEGPLKGFAIAGADRQYVWADARIEGDTVVVWNEKIAQPVAVRYAWAKHPICNLANAERLPAVPFRTDNWAKTTAER